MNITQAVDQLLIFGQQIKKSEGVRQSLMMVVGNTMATGISAVSLMMISRLLGPSLFGEFSVGFALAMILNRFNDAGLSSAALKYAGGSSDIKQINRYFSITLLYRLILSLILTAIGLASATWLTDLLNLEHRSIVVVAVVAGLSAVYYEQLLTMLQSLQLFSESVVANAMQAIVKVIGAIGFLWFQFKLVVPIFAWYLAAPIVPIIFAKKFLPNWLSLSFNKLPSAESSKIVIMAKHSSVAFISTGIIEHLGVLFVQGFLSSYETGLLGGVYRIALLFSLMALSLGQVLFPRVAKYKDKVDLTKYIRKAFLLSGLFLASYLLVLPFAKLMIILTIGPDYLSGLGVLHILLAAVFLNLAPVPFLALFYSFDAPWYFSVNGVLQILLTIVGGMYFIPIYGLPAAAWTQFVTRLIIWLVTIGLSMYFYRKNFK